MVKYIRKAKASDEVASMEAIAEPLGVCTRSRTLALQKQRMQTHGEGAVKKEYLELRSRKLEKIPPQKAAKRRKTAEKKEAEASFLGENTFTSEATRRASRETTPCNLITTVSEMVTTNGSTTRPSHSTSNGKEQALVGPTTQDLTELKELVDAQTRRDQQAFMEKYNFDPVNDCPLPGRYEWVKLK